MPTYRIVNMYPERKAVNGIYYDTYGNPIRAYRIDKKHSLLFGLICYWDHGAYNLCPEYSFPSIIEAERAILKAENFPRTSKIVTILYQRCKHFTKRQKYEIDGCYDPCEIDRNSNLL